MSQNVVRDFSPIEAEAGVPDWIADLDVDDFGPGFHEVGIAEIEKGGIRLVYCSRLGAAPMTGVRCAVQESKRAEREELRKKNKKRIRKRIRDLGSKSDSRVSKRRGCRWYWRIL